MVVMVLALLLCFQHLAMGEITNNTLYWSDSQLTMKKLNKFVDKGQLNGCLFKENSNQSVLIYGADCQKYPSSYEVKKMRLKIKTTGITVIRRNDFKKLDSLTTLVLESNSKLNFLEPGCFKPMKCLTYLRMTLNYNLRHLEVNVFEGLNNLRYLSLRKNGFITISDISVALIPAQVPNLIYLDLSENLFGVIQQNDFIFMNNSKLEELELSLCALEFIHEDSLLVFKTLKTLGIDGNHFNITNLKNVILNFEKYGIPLEALNLQDSGYRSNPPYDLMEVISQTNVSKLSLAENQFQLIKNDSFPQMPKLRSLDLSNNLIIHIESHAFAGFTSLENLYLAGNKFAKVYPAILLPHLKVLDLSRMSNKPTAISYFTIEDNIFEKMTMLEELRLSYNLIQSVNIYTLKGLINLKYLEMRNSTIFNILGNTFLSTPKLTYLNIENNPMQAKPLTSESFAGLSNLNILLLGGCNIVDLTAKPSPFYNLPNLTYLGLNNNIIYSLTPHIFAPLPSIKTLDLSNNILTPWNKRLFSNNSLEYIDLSQNKFTLLTRAMLDDFKNISFLNVDGNPFICDCNLIPSDSLNEILSNSNYTSILEANCSNVEFQDKSIRDFILYVKDKPNYCSPDTANNNVVIILSSTSIIFLCITIILMYIYRNYLRYWLFLVKMASQRHSRWWKNGRKQKFTNFKYDAFVSYSCFDCYFVNKLVSQLENNAPYLKLCVYQRDFKIGSIISEEVLQSILKSKRTLLVISDGFAKSQWCRWETKLAEHHQIFFQNDDSMSLDDTLVMVKLNDVPKKHITPTLKYLMKTRIYLEWDRNKEQEFWQKLRNTLSAPKYFSPKYEI